MSVNCPKGRSFGTRVVGAVVRLIGGIQLGMYNFLLCLISSSPSGFIAYSLARPDMLMLAIALFICPVVST